MSYRSETCRVAIVAVSMAIFALSGCRVPRRHEVVQPKVDETIRAIWVTRWDYKTPGDIARIMHNCDAAGFNTVLFQVRGNGTVLYRSRLEPWAKEFGGSDPGYDPLSVACREAHQRGLTLHAWVNVMPGWRGDKPPANPRQLYRAHPDWFWRDGNGRRQPLGWYNSLNPCYVEVRRYLVAVMHEIVAKYQIDGLHMDYIRFPNEWHKSYGRSRRVPDYPRDPKTLALFRQATGQTPETAPRLWNEWRTAQVTQLVRDIRSMIRDVKPSIQLSAAVGASPEEARRSHFQDSRRWISEGLLDAVYPMNYAEDMATFSDRLGRWRAMRLQIPVITGVMMDERSGATVVKQLDLLRRTTDHFAAFAYNSFFERSDRRGQAGGGKGSAARAALRRSVIPYVRSIATSPT